MPLRTMYRALAAATVLGCLVLKAHCGGDAEPAEARLRRPVALVPVDEGRRLFVANRAGSVSVIDVERRRVIAAVSVGRCLADLVDAGAGRLLAVEESAGEG